MCGSTETQILLGMFGLMWVTATTVGGFMIKFMLDIKGDLAEIKADIAAITKRLDSVETGITARR